MRGRRGAGPHKRRAREGAAGQVGGRMRIWAWMLLVAAGACPAAGADARARGLVDRMVERDAELVRRRAALVYTLETVRIKLDVAGRETSRTRELKTMGGAARGEYGTREGRDGAMEGDLRRASEEEPFELLTMLDHYEFTVAGAETVHGEACAVVAYAPRPGMPHRNREQKVLNHTSGRMWIREADGTLMRNEGRLMGPVAVAWFFATLREMAFRFETARLPNGDYGPASVAYQFHVKAMMADVRERHERRMLEYRER